MIIVIQATSSCNLNCSYCYLSEESRKQKHKISEETLTHIFQKTLTHFFVKDKVRFLWHSGEPLAAGIHFYKQAIDMIHRYNEFGHPIIHSIQTNATMLNDAWCSFFKDNDFHVGVSVDGPAFLHDKYRKTWDGKGSHSKVMAGLSLLKHYGVSFGGLCTLTAESLKYPNDIYEFFLENEFTSLGFNLEEIISANKQSSLSQNDNDLYNIQSDYLEFMRVIYERNYEMGRPIKIRETENLAHQMKIKQINPAHFPLPDVVRPFDILSFNTDGSMSTFAPEFANGADHDASFFTIGNINEIDNLEDVLLSPVYKKLKQQLNEGVDKCKQGCAYFPICGSQFTASKFYENGTMNSTETMVCKLNIQTLTQLLIDSGKKKLSPIPI